MLINWARRAGAGTRTPAETVRELRSALGSLDPEAFVWLTVKGQGAVLKSAEIEIVDDHVYLNLSDRPVKRARHKRTTRRPIDPIRRVTRALTPSVPLRLADLQVIRTTEPSAQPPTQPQERPQERQEPAPLPSRRQAAARRRERDASDAEQAWAG